MHSKFKTTCRQTSAVTLAAAAAVAAIGGLSAGVSYASGSSTFIKSDIEVRDSAGLPSAQFEIEHQVVAGDMVTEEEIATHPGRDAYVRRLQHVQLWEKQDGTRNSVELENIDWSYKILSDSTLPNAVAGGVIDIGHNSALTSTGESANFSLTMENSFGQDPNATSAVIFIEGSDSMPGDSLETAGVLNLNADETTIKAVATRERAHSIHGVLVDNFGTINMNGSHVTIDVRTDSNTRPDFEPIVDTDPFESYGLSTYSPGTISTSANTILDINVTGTGDNADDSPLVDSENAVAANIAGIYAESGTLDFRGATNVTVTGNGNFTFGVQLWAKGVDTDIEDLANYPNLNQNTTFGKRTSFNVRSEKSQAIGLLVGGAWFDTDLEDAERGEYAKYLGKVTVTAEDDFIITAESPDEAQRSIGIAFNRWGGADAEVTLKGTTVITAEDALGTFGDELIA